MKTPIKQYEKTIQIPNIEALETIIDKDIEVCKLNMEKEAAVCEKVQQNYVKYLAKQQKQLLNFMKRQQKFMYGGKTSGAEVKLEDLVEVKFTEATCKVEAEHEPTDNYKQQGVDVKHVITDAPRGNSMWIYYVNKKSAWITVDFKDEEQVFFGLGIQACDRSWQHYPTEVRIYNDNNGEWEEICMQELKFQQPATTWRVIKFVIPETSTTKLKFAFTNT